MCNRFVDDCCSKRRLYLLLDIVASISSKFLAFRDFSEFFDLGVTIYGLPCILCGGFLIYCFFITKFCLQLKICVKLRHLSFLPML